MLAFLAVLAGAFGAHALRARLAPDLLQTFEVAVRYQLAHALALFAVAWAADRSQHPSILRAGWLFVIGSVLFSGSLYVLALTSARWLGVVTPFGGLCLLAGWLMLAHGFADAGRDS
ncbi:MAG TPA: DUF423 domain-containing protein [Candidatus Limnocylindria bacterium]|nr:DUF423 domain-containing protein [Candidatus Limnocylindria bacterium]